MVNPQGLFDAGVEAFTLPSSLFGLNNPHLTSFSAELVSSPKQRPCLWSCMLSHRPSDYAVIAILKIYLMHGVEASPCHPNCLGQTTHISHRFPSWVCLAPQTTFWHNNPRLVSTCMGSVALPQPGSPDCEVDIQNF